MDLVTAINQAIEPKRDLSMLEKVLPKLLNNLDLVTEKLGIVFNELAKSYQAIDAAMRISQQLFWQSLDLEKIFLS